jgi:hypothetical protein
LGEGHGLATDARLELDHLGHLPEGRVIGVHEEMVFTGVPSRGWILDQDLGAGEMGGAKDLRHAAYEAVGATQLA